MDENPHELPVEEREAYDAAAVAIRKAHDDLEDSTVMVEILEVGDTADYLAREAIGAYRAAAAPWEDAELRLLRDNQQRLIEFDGSAELMSWANAHKLHDDEPYIGCPFCRDRFVVRTRTDPMETHQAQYDAIVKLQDELAVARSRLAAREEPKDDQGAIQAAAVALKGIYPNEFADSLYFYRQAKRVTDAYLAAREVEKLPGDGQRLPWQEWQLVAGAKARYEAERREYENSEIASFVPWENLPSVIQIVHAQRHRIGLDATPCVEHKEGCDCPVRGLLEAFRQWVEHGVDLSDAFNLDAATTDELLSVTRPAYIWRSGAAILATAIRALDAEKGSCESAYSPRHPRSPAELKAQIRSEAVSAESIRREAGICGTDFPTIL